MCMRGSRSFRSKLPAISRPSSSSFHYFYTPHLCYSLTNDNIFYIQQTNHAWLCFCFRQKNVAILCVGEQLNQVPVLVLQQIHKLSLEAQGTVRRWYVLLPYCVTNTAHSVQPVFCYFYSQRQLFAILKPRFPFHDPLQPKQYSRLYRTDKPFLI